MISKMYILEDLVSAKEANKAGRGQRASPAHSLPKCLASPSHCPPDPGPASPPGCHVVGLLCPLSPSQPSPVPAPVPSDAAIFEVFPALRRDWPGQGLQPVPSGLRQGDGEPSMGSKGSAWKAAFLEGHLGRVVEDE